MHIYTYVALFHQYITTLILTLILNLGSSQQQHFDKLKIVFMESF